MNFLEGQNGKGSVEFRNKLRLLLITGFHLSMWFICKCAQQTNDFCFFTKSITRPKIFSYLVTQKNRLFSAHYLDRRTKFQKCCFPRKTVLYRPRRLVKMDNKSKALRSLQKTITKKRQRGLEPEGNQNRDAPKPGKRLSQIQLRLKGQLESADFRMLNETFYTQTGAEAKSLLEERPELFRAYHAGYARQVQRWPRNPLDDVISYLKTRNASLRVADLGCGEGRLRTQVKQTVHSFDLASSNEDIVACDISHVPLDDSCIDIAVFCLSLMGTDYPQFLAEARRILTPGGTVLIAEVASRFEKHDPTSFIHGVHALGFRHDAAHPFARDLTDISAGSSDRRGRIRLKSRGGIKRKKGKKSSTPDVDVKKDHHHTKFFFKFAFVSTKKSGEKGRGSNCNTRLAAPLAPCVYKRR